MTTPGPARQARRPALRWLVFASAASGVMALAQIWIPLTSRRAGPTVIVVTAAAVATLGFTISAWGLTRAALALATVVTLSLIIERVGVGTGWPFGRYRYTGVLQPEIWHVPVIVPLAWFALGLPARETAARLVPRGIARVAVAAAALTAWDLFLDPQMVDERYWRWRGGGAWRGVPLSNYAGWLVTSFMVLGLVELIAPRRAADDDDEGRLGLLGMYTWWTVMETVGFIVFFGDPVVGLVGGAAMGLPTTLAWRRLLARRGGGVRRLVGQDRGVG